MNPFKRLRADRPTAVLVVIVIVTIAFAAGQHIYIQTRPEVRTLLDYPEQRVLNRLPGLPDRPASTLRQDLSVRGTKCNRGSTDIAIAGTTTWVSIDPPGSTILTGEGSTERPTWLRNHDVRERNPRG